MIAWRVDRRWLAGSPADARVLGLAVVFTGALVSVHLLPGLLGLLSPAAVLLTAAAAAVAGWALTRGTPAGTSRQGTDAAGPGRLAGIAAIAIAGCAVAMVRDLAGAPVTSIDALNFQVPIVGRWLQQDSIWGLHQFIPDYSNATYPMHGNLLVAAFVLPFESAFLARLVAVPYWALAALAAYALGRELGAPRSGALLAATALAALPISIRSGLEGVQTDAPMLACFGAGGVFLLRHARTARRHELVLAAVGLGLAFGTKWYAVTGVTAVLLVWLAVRRWAALAQLPRVATLVAVAGGFWLLRNWIETGNPVFPQELGPFDAPPDPIRELSGFTIADYAFDAGVWNDYLLPIFTSSFGWAGAALAAGAVAAAVRRPRGPVLAVLAATTMLAAAYAVTPYSAFGPEGRPVLAGASTRYALPALLGAAALTAWALGGLGRRWRTAAEAVLAVAILDGARRGFADLSAAKALGGAIAVAAAAALVASIRRHPRAVAAAAALMLLASLVAVDATRRRAADTGYAQFDPTLAWLEANAPSGTRVGLAGTWTTDGVSPVLPAFGPRFGNDVRFVGEFREDMLRSYEDPAAFLAALDGHDLLFVGRGAPPRPTAREERWAEAAGWRQVAESERLVLLEAP